MQIKQWVTELRLVNWISVSVSGNSLEKSEIYVGIFSVQ